MINIPPPPSSMNEAWRFLDNITSINSQLITGLPDVETNWFFTDSRTYPTFFIQVMHLLEHAYYDQKQYIVHVGAKAIEADFLTYISKQAPTDNEYTKLTIGEHIDSTIQNVYYKKGQLYFKVSTYGFESWETIFKLYAIKEQVLIKEFPDQHDDLFLNFYKALATKDYKTAKVTFNEIINSKKVRSARYSQLKECFKPHTETRKNALRDRLENEMDSRERLLKRFAEKETMIKQLSEEYEALCKVVEKDVSQEVLDSILKNPYILNIQKLNEHVIRITFDAPLLYYDCDAIEHYKKESNHGTTKELLYNILLDKRFQIYTTCQIDFNTTTFSTTALESFDINQKYKHPHISRYRCLGNHTDEITAWIKQQDYVGAITQITAAALNLNVHDYIVIDSFVNNMQDPSTKRLKTFYDTKEEKFVNFETVEEYYKGEQE